MKTFYEWQKELIYTEQQNTNDVYRSIFEFVKLIFPNDNLIKNIDYSFVTKQKLDILFGLGKQGYLKDDLFEIVKKYREELDRIEAIRRTKWNCSFEVYSSPKTLDRKIKKWDLDRKIAFLLTSNHKMLRQYGEYLQSL